MKRTLIIAEAGVNHNGNIKLAHELVEVAAKAGADVIKFQTFKANEIATDLAIKANYQKEVGGKEETQREMLDKLELTKSQHFDLKKYAQRYKIEFLSTGFDLNSIDFLNTLDLQRFKIPSGEITNYPYLYKIGGLGKKIILSTGMANLGEIEVALDVLEKAGTSRNKITVLHCTSEYPTPISNVNLKAIKTISKAFNVDVGYSDHTLGIDIAIAAVALGASIIEKHITVSKKLEGPDHKASLEPNEFKKMVDSIRNIEKAFGDGIKKPTIGEQDTLIASRKSLIAKEKIKRGEVFSEENLTTKRPFIGISPMRWNEFLGKKASKNYNPDELIDY